MKKLILSFFATLLTVAVMAQNVVTGKVTYAGDNSPIVGAVVQVKDTKTKTVSNADGNFSIQATPGQTLVKGGRKAHPSGRPGYEFCA